MRADVRELTNRRGIQRSYAPGSSERKGLVEALAQMEKELPFEVPCIVNGKEVRETSPLSMSRICSSQMTRTIGPHGQAREAAHARDACEAPLHVP